MTGVELVARHLKRRSAIDYDSVIAVAGEEGCLSGDSLIRISRHKSTRTYSLSRFYRQFCGNKLNGHSFDRSIPSFIRSFNGEEIRLNKIKQVLYSGIKAVWLIKLENGLSLKATLDHRFLTKDGWIELENIYKGLEVVCDTLHPEKNNRKKIKLYDVQLPVGDNHPFGNGKRHRKEVHILIYEARLNGLDFVEYLDILLNDKEKSKTLKFVDTSLYEIHHKDGFHYNNSIENLELMKKREHKLEHSDYSNFSQGIPKLIKVLGVEFVGEEETYDICCEDPYHNFVANGIVVHNSGKSNEAIKIAEAIDPNFDLKESEVFSISNDEIFQKMTNRKIKVLIFDEAIKNLYKLNWASASQKYLNTLWSLARQENKVVIMCLPRFRDINEFFRNHRIRFWLQILVRGESVLFVRDTKNIFSKDPWHLDQNSKFMEEAMYGSKLNDVSLNKWKDLIQKTKNFVAFIEYDDFTPEKKLEYLEIVGSHKYTDINSLPEAKINKWDLTKIHTSLDLIEFIMRDKNLSQAKACALVGLDYRKLSDWRTIVGRSLKDTIGSVSNGNEHTTYSSTIGSMCEGVNVPVGSTLDISNTNYPKKKFKFLRQNT